MKNNNNVCPSLIWLQVASVRKQTALKLQARTAVWIPSGISQIADVKRFSNSFGKTPAGETVCKKHSRNRLLGQFNFSATFLPALTEYSYTDEGRRRDGVGNGSGGGGGWGGGGGGEEEGGGSNASSLTKNTGGHLSGTLTPHPHPIPSIKRPVEI